MRTKTLLLTAALVAAGVASSMAQSNVYSLNVVGYVNVVAPSGFSIVNNPLDSGTNTVGSLFPTVANGTIIYTFSPTTGFVGDNYLNGWGTPATAIAPGTGFFYYNPTSSPITNTFVGTVIQGSTTNALSAGFTLAGSIAPLSGPVTNSTINLPAANGSIVYTFDPSTGYTGYNYLNGWTPSVPSINVGQGFFVFQSAAVNWLQTFNVQ